MTSQDEARSGAADSTEAGTPGACGRLKAHLNLWGYDLICCYFLVSTTLWVARYYFSISGEGFALHHEDDVQYYLKIAQNLSNRFPFTFDRLQPTNGFHPLWVLVLQPLCLWFTQPEDLVRAAFILQFLMFVACVALLYLILLTVTNKSRLIALCISLYFALDNHFYKTIINGLETPLFVFLCLLLLLLLLRGHEVIASGQRWSVGIGLLCGLVILSRLDGGFFHVFGLMIALGILSRHRATLRGMAAAALACGLPVALYLGLCMAYTGSPWPVSGLIKALRAAGPPDHSMLAVLDFPNLYNFDYFPLLLSNHLPFDRWAAHLPGSYHSYYVEAPRHILFSSAAWILVYGCYAVLRFRDRHAEPAAVSCLTWFAVSALVLVGFNKHFYNYRGDILPYWYPVTFSIAQLLLVGYIISKIEWSRGRWLGVMLIAILMTAFVTKSLAIHQDRKHWLMARAGYTNWLDAAYWLRDHSDPDARAAAYNAGIIGFFSERRVMNLDGLVNSPAYFRGVLQLERTDPEGARRNRLAFLRSNGIQYFADIVPVDDASYWQRAFSSDRIKVNLQEMFRTSPAEGYSGAVYKLSWVEP